MDYRPAGRLVPIFSASENLNEKDLTLSLARAASARGETVLMIDAQNGALMEHAGIIYYQTFSDVLAGRAELGDTLYVTSNEHFSALCLGEDNWCQSLGSLGALSLQYDWVLAAPPAGCTPAHVNLATASDMALMLFDCDKADFMRAFWMLESIRFRDPNFDPILIADGPLSQASETGELLCNVIRSFLGAPPDYLGHCGHPGIANWVLQAIRYQTLKVA